MKATKSLEALLARDLTFAADGGRIPAAPRVLEGARTVAQVFSALFRKAAAGAQLWRAVLNKVNGETALLTCREGALDTVFVFSVADGRIASIRAVRNPEKLVWYLRYEVSRSEGRASESGVDILNTSRKPN